jgi:hypothetical protein
MCYLSFIFRARVAVQGVLDEDVPLPEVKEASLRAIPDRVGLAKGTHERSVQVKPDLGSFSLLVCI